jgi:hypothetical protein
MSRCKIPAHFYFEKNEEFVCLQQKKTSAWFTYFKYLFLI